MQINGLRVLSQFVNETEAAALLAAVDAAPFRDDLRRRVQHYGYRYDYTRKTVDRSLYLGELPAWVQPLCRRLASADLFGRQPDQLIVNEYLPGQGIAGHVDCVPCFGPTVVSLTLGSGCQMELSSLDTAQGEAVYLRPRDLLVLQGEARYRWKHGIRARRNDRIGGQVVPRGRRVSLTFRAVVLSPEQPTAR